MTEGKARPLLIQLTRGHLLNSTMLTLLLLATLFLMGKQCDAADSIASGTDQEPNTLSSSHDEHVEKKGFANKPRSLNDEADLLLSEEEVERFDDHFIDDDEGFNEESEDEVDNDAIVDADENSEELLDKDDLWLFQYDPVEVGHIQDVEMEDGSMLKMKTLAINPPIFEIRNFLSAEECDHIKALAIRKGLQTSQTVPDKPDQTDEELERVLDYFEELDQDQNGLINGTELFEAIKSFPSAQNFNLTIEHVEALIKEKLDHGGDCLLDVDEFIYADTPAMEDEIDRWLAVIGDLGEEEAKRTQPRVSEQAWLDQWTTEDEVLVRLQDRVISLTLLPPSIIQTSEHLQVVRYQPGGHYHAHYDSEEFDDDLECSHTFGIEDSDDERRYRSKDDFTEKRLCRLATILYYLNDVEEGGGTAFPVADNETFTQESLDGISYDIYDLSNHCYKSNVVVPPEKGKAILWYNHYLDEENGWIGENRNHSLHGGCDVIKGTKWIANNWITVDHNVERQILFHDRYYSHIDQQFPSEAESAEHLSDDGTEIDEQFGDGDDDEFAQDEGFGSETGDTRRTTEHTSDNVDMKSEQEGGFHSSDHAKETEGQAENLSHHKTREKLDNDESGRLDSFSSTHKSGTEFRKNDEL
ncbi:transmembrane prolyl 4-hydroxylase-like [Lytechinus variegatus]|uniref:transmembrane prolyl 4-hydroxylase-like n=1 Tax=Lytechinus variegatus TaxID=7654 RepID=UPI001BB24F33|nr:transmembrane prolyl 4-hydroxylase-like [Lytechinus variegatus]XP_041475395.1 transmembrane prolyl 4-hydroxylase-like [Lytechinus variegatus]